MKKFTKLAAGVGIAGILLTGATAANANETDTIGTQATSTGTLQTTNGGNLTLNTWAAGQASSLTVGSTGKALTLPGNGQTGPITDGSLCLTTSSTTGEFARIAPQACDGSARQQFTVQRNEAGTLYGITVELNGVQRPVAYVLSTRMLQVNRTGPGTVEIWNVSALSDDEAPGEVAPVDITGVTAGLRPTLSGTGEPGATVVLTMTDGTEIGTGTVGEDGKWRIPSTVTLAQQEYTVTATQTMGEDVTTDTLTFEVIPAPIVDPLVAGGTATVLAAAAGAFLLTKRRKNAQATA